MFARKFRQLGKARGAIKAATQKAREDAFYRMVMHSTTVNHRQLCYDAMKGGVQQDAIKDFRGNPSLTVEQQLRAVFDGHEPWQEMCEHMGITEDDVREWIKEAVA